MYSNVVFELQILILSLWCFGTSGTVSWPEGLYGLPMAASGCPKDKTINWKIGTLFQDCEDKNPLTKHSANFHLKAHVTSYGDVQRSFCMKTSGTNDQTRSKWPSGKYCVYLSGQSCPWGMKVGWVVWDDENNHLGYNRNTNSGTLPAGVYGQDTKIYYCCSTDGSISTPINLPLDWSFYLIAYGDKICQAVKGATSTLEYIFYEKEYFTVLPKDDYGGAHPYGVSITGAGHTIYYCFYTPMYCSGLRKPDHGDIKPARCLQSYSNKFNDTCSVTCDAGYVHVTSTSINTTCLETGTWSNTALTGCRLASTATSSIGSHSILTTSVLQPTPSTSARLPVSTYTSIPRNRTTSSSTIIGPKTSTTPQLLTTQLLTSTQSIPGHSRTVSTMQDWKPTETASLTSSFVSSVTRSSRVLSTSSSAQSPRPPSVGSSVQPSGVGARSPKKRSLATSLLVGISCGVVGCLVIVLVLFLAYKRRNQNMMKPRSGTNVKVYMSEVEKSLSMEDLVSGRPVMLMQKSTSQENLLYEGVLAAENNFQEKSQENILYESCSPANSSTKTSENIIYESMSLVDEHVQDLDLGGASHLHYKTIT